MKLGNHECEQARPFTRKWAVFVRNCSHFSMAFPFRPHSSCPACRLFRTGGKKDMHSTPTWKYDSCVTRGFAYTVAKNIFWIDSISCRSFSSDFNPSGSSSYVQICQKTWKWFSTDTYTPMLKQSSYLYEWKCMMFPAVARFEKCENLIKRYILFLSHLPSTSVMVRNKCHYNILGQWILHW